MRVIILKEGAKALRWRKYRIVRDHYNGYCAQVKTWWFPVWRDVFFCNTVGTVEKARYLCDCHNMTVVEYYVPKHKESGL